MSRATSVALAGSATLAIAGLSNAFVAPSSAGPRAEVEVPTAAARTGLRGAAGSS
eukprot:CAMPEP_0195071902 /NCGR_PEP_ID=MMETSP0448-20130528/15589_1 /TAXON_ID=66468 /ORGANISM="Heterocapsa triquestra, Strain CCMP 448" /LENGTH=54 /DNA_ID=CAMNT_0040103809 /DNA_START=47 /DNA_END=207 /DNA_ORIENTATION=-